MNNMNTAATRQKPPRRYAFACSQCRRKKIRCDGEQPACRRCRQSSDSCSYPQRTAESRLEYAQARIEQLESELVQARNTVSPASSSALHTSVSLEQGPESDATETQDDISPHVGLDEHGEVTYHGPTSRFSAGGLTDLQLETKTQQNSYATLQKDHAAALESNYDMLHQVWEPLLHSKTKEELGVEPAIVHRLLNHFWTWQYPLHSYLYKPCFVMDMALGGPYYSKFLLHSILALSARHLNSESADNELARKGETFLSTAKELLMKELSSTKPRIPTIQGLLILSGRQCAVGKTSEGWLYLGMAIRMMTDLGLHLDFHHLMHLEKLTPVELELRKRLYCSAYIWDKSLSLSLGRPPTLKRLPAAALDFLDHADDQTDWIPEEYPGYPDTKARITTCFTFFCRLGPIIELIMLPVPRSTSSAALKERLNSIEQRLHIWYEELPPTLKMDSTPDVCPPPHILSCNLLYHTLHIILWRPYVSLPDMASQATAACVSRAQTVHDMFLVYGRTFQWQKMTYLVSYCVYTAATVDVHEMKSPDMQRRQDAAKRLAVSLQILESEAKQTPGIRRSIDIIKRQLRSWTPNASESSSRGGAEQDAMQEDRPSNTYVQPALQTDVVPNNNDYPQQRAQISTNGQYARSVASYEPNNVFLGQSNQMFDTAGNLFGFEFGDTSAGFHQIPWSLDEASNFNYFDTPFYGDENTF